nr:sigma-54-dependent Fis family transcriptional regulator [Calditrichia bacterium]
MNIPEQYLQALVAISEEINSIQEPAALLNRILEIALRELSAERGFILLRDEESGELTPHAAWNLAPDAISDIREISSTAVESVLRDQKSILTFDTDTDGKFDQSQSVVLNKIRSI